VWKPVGNRPLERSRRRWEYINKMDFQEVGSRGMDKTDLTKDKKN
jgi:hypothetical protein